MTENNGSSGGSEMQVVFVPFHEDQIQAIQDIKTGEVFVAIRRICENLRIQHQRQIQKLKGCAWGEVTKCDLLDLQGLVQETWVIPLEKVSMWLSQIQVKRCRPEIRERLIAYQAECAVVLDRHFRPTSQPKAEPAPFDADQFAQVMGVAIANQLAPLHKTQTVLMADNARIHERVSKHDERLRILEENRNSQMAAPPRGPQPRGPQARPQPTPPRVEPRRRNESFDSWLTVWEYCKPRGIPFDARTLRVQSAKIGALAKDLGYPPMCRYVPELQDRRKIYPVTVLHEFYGSPREREYRANNFDFGRRSATGRGRVEVDNGAADM